MIAKKNGKADLERKRFAFFQIGLIVAGSICLVAFEYSSAEAEKRMVQFSNDGPTWSADVVLPDLLDLPKPETNNSATVVMEPVDEVTISSVNPTPEGVITSGTISITGDAGSGEIGEIVDEDTIYEVVDQEPKFVGGDAALMNYLKTSLKYPELAHQMGIGGMVYVGFIVNTDGSISGVTSQNEVNKDLQKEAERVVKAMPKWIPGEQAGKKVRVRYTVPINFVFVP